MKKHDICIFTLKFACKKSDINCKGNTEKHEVYPRFLTKKKISAREQNTSQKNCHSLLMLSITAILLIGFCIAH